MTTRPEYDEMSNAVGGGGCCAPFVPGGEDFAARAPIADLSRYLEPTDRPGVVRLNLLVDGITCGRCIVTIEDAMRRMAGMESARVNMSSGRLAVIFRTDMLEPQTIVNRLDAIGYRAAPFDPGQFGIEREREEKRLLRALAVAGFAAANVMLLSVAIWAGHTQGMGEATRTLLHWISALIAIPAVVYAGRPFFDSAMTAIRGGRLNMDVPISLAVVLATGMSVNETMRGAEHAYFDSAVTLLFFLLIGRYLDRRARGKARSAAEHLIALNAVSVTVIHDDGSLQALPPEAVRTGMTVLVAAGERIPVDGEILSGRTELDTALITGESVPEAAGPGSRVFAGATNLSAPLKIRVTAAGEGTLLSEIARLTEAAEQRKAKYVTLADTVARWYAPVVHVAALSAFLGWFLIAGIPWQDALLIAIAVLIVTCPCALGLAVPVVQVVASGRLLKQGILLKSGSALERLAQIDTVVFDKTGTLTTGKPKLVRDESDAMAEADFTLRRAAAIAAAIAAASVHPLARALVEAAGPRISAPDDVCEVPGAGLVWQGGDGEHRLGSRRHVGVDADAACDDTLETMELWYRAPDAAPVRYRFEDRLRDDAGEVVATLKRQGIAVELISGDRAPVVARTAALLGVEDWQAEVTPDGKTARLEALRQAGCKVAMVGDGLNDAPALAGAHVSLSPTSAADISQTAADIVFQGDGLHPVVEARDVAMRSATLIRQNFALAFSYNVITVPLAMLGFVTPLLAAVAMSSSSLVVISNALRLGWIRRAKSTIIGTDSRGAQITARVEAES